MNTYEFLKGWRGTFEVSEENGAISIHLYPEGYQREASQPTASVENINDVSEYIVKVKAWMTKPSTPDFDFMDKFNDGIPMPLRTMVGSVDKRTAKMVHMNLHGDIIQEINHTCMCCGKEITNDVSKYFGMGPVCGGHNYVNPFSSKEELKKAVADYRVKLQNIQWSGWIPVSAIEEMLDRE